MEQPEKTTTYTPAVKKAIDKYRKKNALLFNEKQREYYSKYKTDDEWRKNFNERCKVNNKKYRDKKKINLGGEVKTRGRPKKVIEKKINIEQIVSNII